MKKPHVLNRSMFNQGGTSAYGKGITSNLVSNEQRHRYNSGGRVGYQDKGFVWPPWTQKAAGWTIDRLTHPWKRVAEYEDPDLWDPTMYKKNIGIGPGKILDVPYEEITGEEIAKTYESPAGYIPPSEERKARAEEAATAAQERMNPREIFEDPVVKEVGEKEPSWAGIPGEGDVASEMLDVKKELDPGADLTDKPEGRIEKMLAENLAKSKQRAKIAALTRGVSMASNLLDKPTFAKAFAAAGKEAPLLAKETAAAMKGAETLPLQWEMIKEKIALTGEEAVRKAEVGEKRKGEYQTAYIDILRDRLDMAKADPDLTVGDLFKEDALKLSGFDQAKLLKELASQKGLVIKIKAIDTSKPENYKNLNKGTIVRDTIEGEWYFIEEKGVLGMPRSQKEITDGIDLQVQKTLSPGR